MSYLDLCNDALGSLGPVLLASLPLLGICQKYVYLHNMHGRVELELSHCITASGSRSHQLLAA
jgi:hypothetical protein